MIKCKHCGNSLNIEQAFCPYCGNPNEYFQKHREDMNEYENEFKKTQTEVYSKTNKYAKKTIYITAICVLVVLHLIVSTLSNSAWIIVDDIKEKKSIDNLEYHIEIVDKLISEEDYITLCRYFSENLNYYSEELDEYSAVSDFAYSYTYFYESLMENQIGYNRESDFDYSIEEIANSIVDMINLLNKENYHSPKAYSKAPMKTMEEMFSRTKDILRVYAGFSDEDLDNLKTYSKGKIMTMLEEGISYNERQ